MTISIIIPAYNEQDIIGETIKKVRQHSGTSQITEIIIADGGSSDATVETAKKAGAEVVSSPVKARSAQMNAGAEYAKGDILYFLHADSIPPEGFDKQIFKSLEQGNDAGCFQLGFDYDHPLLRFYSWCTRFDINLFRFGDQSLFITQKLFEKIGGFKDDLVIMEDQEIINRIRKEGTFAILKDQVVTSSRRYLKNGIVKLQLFFSLITILYYLGLSQEKLVSVYKKLID